MATCGSRYRNSFLGKGKPIHSSRTLALETSDEILRKTMMEARGSGGGVGGWVGGWGFGGSTIFCHGETTHCWRVGRDEPLGLDIAIVRVLVEATLLDIESGPS